MSEIDTMQQILKYALALLSTVFSAILAYFFKAINDLRKSNKELADKISAVEIIVVGDYVKAEEFDKKQASHRLELQAGFDKMFGKVDQLASSMNTVKSELHSHIKVQELKYEIQKQHNSRHDDAS